MLAEIIRNAISAAREDPRFLPVDESELTGLTIKVDVLYGYGSDNGDRNVFQAGDR